MSTSTEHRYCPTCDRETPHRVTVNRNFGGEVMYEDAECRVCRS